MRKKYNKVGCPELPDKPTINEIVSYLKEKAIWEELQPYGRKMDAREWAATCLKSAAETIEASVS